MNDPAGQVGYVSKPAILKVGNAAVRGDPNSPVNVLKEGLDGIVGQSTALRVVSRDAPVIPSIQAIARAEPNAAVPGRQDGRSEGIRQPLLDGNRRGGEVAKAVEPIKRSDPNIAFAVLKETRNHIA